jgi:hypothetical protein
MKEFDFERAYKELAEPAWGSLSEQAQYLLGRVMYGHAASVGQDPESLDAQWPETAPLLRSLFEKLSSEELALASAAVYAAGHWAPRGSSGALLLQPHGVYWKFSSYCDQVLRDRLGLPAREGSHAFGRFKEVHQGYLRLCCATPASCAYHEIGLATGALSDAITDKLGLAKSSLRGSSVRTQWDAFSAETERVAMALRSLYRCSPDFIDLERFMTEVQ